jgi:hypothetical protein
MVGGGAAQHLLLLASPASSTSRSEHVLGGGRAVTGMFMVFPSILTCTIGALAHDQCM